MPYAAWKARVNVLWSPKPQRAATWRTGTVRSAGSARSRRARSRRCWRIHPETVLRCGSNRSPTLHLVRPLSVVLRATVVDCEAQHGESFAARSGAAASPPRPAPASEELCFEQFAKRLRRMGGSGPGTALPTIMIVVLTACLGCIGATTGAGSRVDGQLVWGKPADVDTLDPTIAGNATNWELLNLSYERLVTLDEDLSVSPQLAESWQQTSPTTYVFTLRDGVRFSNGRELTAEDFVGSLRRIMDPAVGSTWASQLAIKEVRSDAPGEVTVTLAEPKTSFVSALAAGYVAILRGCWRLARSIPRSNCWAPAPTSRSRTLRGGALRPPGTGPCALI